MEDWLSKLSSENPRASTQGTHPWPESTNSPRLEGFHSVFQNQVLRTDAFLARYQVRSLMVPCPVL